MLDSTKMWQYLSFGSPRKRPSRESAQTPEHVVPFGPSGAGQWTGHPVGLVVVVGIIIMVLVGIPEARPFFLTALLLGAVLGISLWLRHRSQGHF